MPSKAQAASSGTVPQDNAIADVKRGVGGLGTIKSEDERRAEGTDASQAEGAGPHDDSPEATNGQIPGGQVLDAYAAQAGSVHDNRSDPGQTLVVGQAPSAPAVPMKGSRAYNEKFHPAIPNAINRSPIVVGVDDETGKPTQVITHEDLKADLVDKDGKPKEDAPLAAENEAA